MKIRPFLTLLALIATPAAAQSAFDRAETGLPSQKTSATQNAFDRVETGRQSPAASQDASHCISWDKKPSMFFGGHLTNSCAQAVKVYFRFQPPNSKRPPIGVGAPHVYQNHSGALASIAANSEKVIGAHYPTKQYEFADAFDGFMRSGIDLFWAACFGEHNAPKYDGADGYYCGKKHNAAAQNPFDQIDTDNIANEIAAWNAAEKRRIAREKAEWERKERERLARLEAERRERERLARLEAERRERERLARLEAERRERERLARLEAERRERERQARLAREEAEREAERQRRIARAEEAERRRRQREQDSGNAFTRGLDAFARGLGGGYSLDNTLRDVQDITRRANEENARRARENDRRNSGSGGGHPDDCPRGYTINAYGEEVGCGINY